MSKNEKKERSRIKKLEDAALMGGGMTLGAAAAKAATKGKDKADTADAAPETPGIVAKILDIF